MQFLNTVCACEIFALYKNEAQYLGKSTYWTHTNILETLWWIYDQYFQSKTEVEGLHFLMKVMKNSFSLVKYVD